MRNLATIASLIREVQRAESNFLARWAAESLLEQPMILNRVIDSVEAVQVVESAPDAHELREPAGDS